MKKQYKVGEFAKKMGVTIGFLKHHEKFGLLQPYTTESGFRYYTEDHAIQVCRCMELQSMGFSVKETAELLRAEENVKVSELFDHQSIRLQQEADRIQMELEFVQGISARCKEHSNRNTWDITSNLALDYLPFLSGGEFVKSGSEPATANWMEHFPMVVLSHRFEIKDGVPRFISSGLSIPCDAPGSAGLNLKRAEKLEFERALQYLSVINLYDEEWGTDDCAVKLLQAPLDLCRKHNFNITGRAMAISVFSSTLNKQQPVDAMVLIELEDD